MRNSVKNAIISFMSNKSKVKLIDLVRHLMKNGIVNNTSGYMTTYMCLKNNIETFDKVSTGIYRLRSTEERKNLSELKLTHYELVERISFMLKNKQMTPAQICHKLRNDNIIHSYKQVWHILNGTDFNSKPARFTTSKWGSVYSNVK